MQVRVQRNWLTGAIEFLFYDTIQGRRYVLKPMGTVNLVEVKTGEPIEPSLIITSECDEDFHLLKSLADALDSLGVKTDSDHKMKGTLEATREHLKDLQRMLKLRED